MSHISAAQIHEATGGLGVKALFQRLRSLKKEIRTTIDDCQRTLEATSAVLADHFKRLPAGQLQTYIQSRFQLWDNNGDGSLDREEMRTAIASLGKKLTDEELDELFKHFDIDGDGTIALDEFEAMVRKSMGLEEKVEEQPAVPDSSAADDDESSTEDDSSKHSTEAVASASHPPRTRVTYRRASVAAIKGEHLHKEVTRSLRRVDSTKGGVTVQVDKSSESLEDELSRKTTPTKEASNALPSDLFVRRTSAKVFDEKQSVRKEARKEAQFPSAKRASAPANTGNRDSFKRRVSFDGEAPNTTELLQRAPLKAGMATRTTSSSSSASRTSSAEDESAKEIPAKKFTFEGLNRLSLPKKADSIINARRFSSSQEEPQQSAEVSKTKPFHLKPLRRQSEKTFSAHKDLKEFTRKKSVSTHNVFERNPSTAVDDIGSHAAKPAPGRRSASADIRDVRSNWAFRATEVRRKSMEEIRPKAKDLSIGLDEPDQDLEQCGSDLFASIGGRPSTCEKSSFERTDIKAKYMANLPRGKKFLETQEGQIRSSEFTRRGSLTVSTVCFPPPVGCATGR